MKSALNHLLGCAADADTRERLRRWIGIFVVEYGQQITVSEKEIVHTGDSFDSYMDIRRKQAFMNAAELIRKNGDAEVESARTTTTLEERIRVFVIKPTKGN